TRHKSLKEDLIFPTPDAEAETPQRMSPRVPQSDRLPHACAAGRAFSLFPLRTVTTDRSQAGAVPASGDPHHVRAEHGHLGFRPSTVRSRSARESTMRPLPRSPPTSRP